MRTNLLPAIAAAAVLLAGCSGGGASSIAPAPGSVGQSAHQATSRSTSILPANLQSRLNVQSNHGVSFNACPASGTLVYLSDAGLNLVNIYKNGTTLCGQLSGFFEPQGLTVNGHNLYVADTANGVVKAFHRGSASPFKTYTDPTLQFPVDVAVAPDGTVIASNIIQQSGGPGSLSTWKPAGGFVGNFVLTNMAKSYFITVFKTGQVYDDGFDNPGAVALWKVKCPHGHCGVSTELNPAMQFPGGLGENNTKDLVASDQLGNTGDTFELPNMNPTTFANDGGDNVDIALNKTNAKWYAGDATNNLLVCYKYTQNGHSSGTCGTVAGNSGGQALGVAIDPAGL